MFTGIVQHARKEKGVYWNRATCQKGERCLLESCNMPERRKVFTGVVQHARKEKGVYWNRATCQKGERCLLESCNMPERRKVFTGVVQHARKDLQQSGKLEDRAVR